MKRILIAAFCCFFISLCNAQQTKPIIVEGRYTAGGYEAQPNESVASIQLLNDTLLQISAAFERNDYRFVIDNSQNLLNQNIEDPRIYTVMAIAYENLEDFDNALYYATQAIAKRPSSVEAYTTRAYAYYKKNDMLRAREDIDTALKFNPKSSRAQKIREIIVADSSSLRQAKKKAAVAKGKELPPWFFVYVVSVIFVIVVFMLIRYKGLLKGPVDEHGRRLKEVNIKEQYNFIRPIGEGGMGKVYEAYDNVLKRKVAVKRIRPELLKSHYVREQFLSEARMVAMLRHPFIVEIYTVIETTNSLYLVFEYVDGQTLETRLDIDSYIPFNEVKEIFGSVCKGLMYAHSNNIVHCDLKPGNIMISDSGVAKVMDFGVAKKIADGEQTDSRTVAGTPAYMSPEQQKGFMTRQSDIYSLAVCLYEALVGQVPWSVKGFDITTKKIVLPSEISPYIPKEVDDLIERSLNDDPSKRIQSVEEFWDILESAEEATHKQDSPE